MTYTRPDVAKFVAANIIPLATQSASKTSSNEVKFLGSRVGFAYAGICINSVTVFESAVSTRRLRQKCLKHRANA